jgi:hypothetical protein
MSPTTVTAEPVEVVTVRIGFVADIDEEMVVLGLRHGDDDLQHVAISSCAAYELRDQLLRTLDAQIARGEDADDDAWEDDDDALL